MVFSGRDARQSARAADSSTVEAALQRPPLPDEAQQPDRIRGLSLAQTLFLTGAGSLGQRGRDLVGEALQAFRQDRYAEAAGHLTAAVSAYRQELEGLEPSRRKALLPAAAVAATLLAAELRRGPELDRAIQHRHESVAWFGEALREERDSRRVHMLRRELAAGFDDLGRFHLKKNLRSLSLHFSLEAAKAYNRIVRQPQTAPHERPWLIKEEGRLRLRCGKLQTLLLQPESARLQYEEGLDLLKLAAPQLEQPERAQALLAAAETHYALGGLLKNAAQESAAFTHYAAAARVFNVVLDSAALAEQERHIRQLLRAVTKQMLDLYRDFNAVERSSVRRHLPVLRL